MLINKMRWLVKWVKKPVLMFFTATTQLFPKSESVFTVYCKHVFVMEFIAVPVIKS